MLIPQRCEALEIVFERASECITRNERIPNKLRLPVAPPAQNKKFFFHFPQQFPNPVAPPGKKSVNSRNTPAISGGSVYVQPDSHRHPAQPSLSSHSPPAQPPHFPRRPV